MWISYPLFTQKNRTYVKEVYIIDISNKTYILNTFFQEERAIKYSYYFKVENGLEI